MNVDVSIVIPGIRQPRWLNLFKSCFDACKNYKWELILAGPWEPLENELKESTKVQWVQTWASPSVATQLATTLARGNTLFFSVDDCVFEENSLDQALDLYYNTGSKKDVVNGKYFEGGNKFDFEKFFAVQNCPEFHLPNIDRSWRVSVQPILNKNYFYNLGGLDCQFEYSNHGFHDLMFRIQRDGGIIRQSPTEICNATHYPNETGDHKPIDNAQIQADLPKFNAIYSDPAQANRIRIDFNNYMNEPEVWTRRFNPNNLPESYQQLYPGLS